MVKVDAKDIYLIIPDAGEIEDADFCDKYNTGFIKKGLDAQKCSSGEEFSGVFSFLEALGASIPLDAIQRLRNKWGEGKITPKDECEMIRSTMSEFIDTRVSNFCYACEKGIGITKKYCFNYNAAEVREKDITRFKNG
jgi:hypothetical protein